MSEPILKVLTPEVRPDFECLVENEFPFAEDVRHYRFPPLDKIVTVSGTILKQHRNIPSDELQNAMDEFVNSMDLSTFGEDEEGEPAEYIKMEDTFSPLYHRIEQAKRWRAIHPLDPIQPTPEVLTRYSKPPEALLQNSQTALERLTKTADVKKVPPKTKGRKRNREVDKPLSGLDVEELLHNQKRGKVQIDPKNAIPEFKRTFDTADNIEGVKEAVRQMGAIIEEQIRSSFGVLKYEQALEELSVMREELLGFQEEGLWNEFLRGLKSKLLAGALGGDRLEMWYRIRKARLGLLGVGDQEAAEFMKAT